MYFRLFLVESPDFREFLCYFVTMSIQHRYHLIIEDENQEEIDIEYLYLRQNIRVLMDRLPLSFVI